MYAAFFSSQTQASMTQVISDVLCALYSHKLKLHGWSFPYACEESEASLRGELEC